MTNTRMIVAAFAICLLSLPAVAAPMIGTVPNFDGTRAVLGYDPSDGSVWIRSPQSMTGLSLKSNSGALIPDNLGEPALFGGFLDIKRSNNIFKLSPAPDDFSELSYGPVLPAGWGPDDLLADLDISGALFPRGKVEELGDPPGVGLLWVPEPSAVTLLACGLLGLLGMRRRRA